MPGSNLVPGAYLFLIDEARIRDHLGVDLYRFCAAPSARLSDFLSEGGRAFPTQGRVLTARIVEGFT